MTTSSAHLPAPAAGPFVSDVMRPPLSVVGRNDHLAAAAYLMKHAGTDALVVLNDTTNEPIGLVTDADVVQAVADGKNVNEIRVHDVMTNRPVLVTATTTIRDAAETMMAGNFQHLPVTDDTGLIGMIDMTDICRALLRQT
jgi:CBS domain-containing protein